MNEDPMVEGANALHSKGVTSRKSAAVAALATRGMINESLITRIEGIELSYRLKVSYVNKGL